MSYVIKNEMTGKFLANRNFSNGILVIEQPVEKLGTWDYEDYKEY